MDSTDKEITILGLEYQYFVNYLNIVLVSFTSFLVALWLSNLPTLQVQQKVYLTAHAFGFAVISIALLHDKLHERKSRIRLTH